MENKKEDKKIFCRIGFGLAAMAALSTVAQIMIVVLLRTFFPSVLSIGSVSFAISAVSLYLVAFPVFFFVVRKIPTENKGKRKRLTFQNAAALIAVSYAATYVFNIAGILLNVLIGLVTRKSIVNPVTDSVMNINIFAVFIYAGVLAPIMEEWIFRRVLLDRLRRYGDVIAILISALAFGMFHGNFSQFFYATALGMIFGFVAVRTNSILYTIALHMVINMIGGVVAPQMVSGNNIVLIGMFGFFLLLVVISGISVFFCFIRKINLFRGPRRLENPGVAFFNPGMVCFYLLCLGMFVQVIAAS